VRATTASRALLSALALTNVVMINFCYDIPVKLWSTELLLMAVFLLLPDLKRLADVFVFNRAAEPLPAEEPLPLGWKTRARPYVKAVLIGCALIAGAQTASSNPATTPSRALRLLRSRVVREKWTGPATGPRRAGTLEKRHHRYSRRNLHSPHG
jgi:hypothetical protein